LFPRKRRWFVAHFWPRYTQHNMPWLWKHIVVDSVQCLSIDHIYRSLFINQEHVTLWHFFWVTICFYLIDSFTGFRRRIFDHHIQIHNCSKYICHESFLTNGRRFLDEIWGAASSAVLSARKLKFWNSFKNSGVKKNWNQFWKLSKNARWLKIW
jgi:hypothetical protein